MVNNHQLESILLVAIPRKKWISYYYYTKMYYLLVKARCLSSMGSGLSINKC